MRVAQCIRSDAFAGAERYVANLAAGLAAQGCDVVVIGGAPDRMGAALLPTGVAWLASTTTPTVVRRLVGARPFDIVHAHMTAAELAAVAASPVIRAPIVATRHFAARRGASPAARVMGRVVTSRLAGQLAISDFVAARIEGPSTVVRPGTAARPATDESGRRPVVLLAQRLEPEKRSELALYAWQASGLSETGWTLRIAGDGHERGGLQELAERLGIAGSCEFLGQRTDIGTLLAQASIFLAPRPDEPYGLSVVEAMAAGLPVVAAAGGGHLETVGRADGAALYPPADTVAAGRLLADLAGDPARRATYGAALREIHRRHFTVEAQVAATLDVYRDLLGATAPLAATRGPS
jgi:glycosyltransferase involved in cell wall biosynthesis